MPPVSNSKLRAAAAARRPGRAAEHAVQDILETAAAARHRRRRRTAAGAEGEGLEAAAGPTPAAAARVAAGKALEARLAFGVDLAAVELLALVLVADDLVGGVQLGKPLRGFRIVLVASG